MLRSCLRYWVLPELMADMITPAGATRKRVKNTVATWKCASRRMWPRCQCVRRLAGCQPTHAVRHATRLSGELRLSSFDVALDVKTNVKQPVEPACRVTARQAPI